jgi:hypothetical protein
MGLVSRHVVSRYTKNCLKKFVYFTKLYSHTQFQNSTRVASISEVCTPDMLIFIVVEN